MALEEVDEKNQLANDFVVVPRSKMNYGRKHYGTGKNLVKKAKKSANKKIQPKLISTSMYLIE